MKLLRALTLSVPLLALSACGNTLDGLKRDLGLVKEGPPIPVTSTAPAASPQPDVLAQELALPVLPYQATHPVPAMTDVGGGFCATSIVTKEKGRKELWKRIGAHPYTGTVQYAVDKFVEVPQPVRAEWTRIVKEGKASNATMRKGDVACSMFYSVGKSHRRWDLIQADWTDRSELPLNEVVVRYGGYEWVLGVPPKQQGGCDNWFWYARKMTEQKAEIKAPPTQVAAVSQSQTVTPIVPSGAVGRGNPPPGQTVGYHLFARFWEEKSFSAQLNKQISDVRAAGESNDRYAFPAVSRDLDGLMIKEWANGNGRATTVKVCVEGVAYYPVKENGVYTHRSESFRACPHDPHRKNPELVYLERYVDREIMRDHPDPQFHVRIKPPQGCFVRYGARGELSTRTNTDGENELKRSFNRGSEGMNLNFILNCSGGPANLNPRQS